MIWFLGEIRLHCEGCAGWHELASPCWTLQRPELDAPHQSMNALKANSAGLTLAM